MVSIRIIEGSGVGTVAEITGGRATLGRETTCDILVTDPKTSRVHAEIVREGGIWHLHDQGSSNGTWTDTGRIDSLVLAEGSVFRIGRTYLRFELGEDPEATQGDAGSGSWLDPAQVEGLRPADPQLMSHVFGGTTTQLARHNAYLVLLHQLVERSRSARTRDELFVLLDDAAAEVLDGDRCAVFLPAERTVAVTGWQLWPPHERSLRARFGAVPFARTLLKTVRRQKEPLLCTIAGDLDPSQSMLKAGVRSAMAAPLRLGDEVHALLYVDRIKGTAPFTRADLEFLAAVANQLAVCVANLANSARMSAEISRLTQQPEQIRLGLIGPSLSSIDELATRAASSAAPVLIIGDSGTGKDLLARIVHQRSARHDRPLQVLSCAGQDAERLLAQFSGNAAAGRPGVLELADSATLLIEEISDLPPSAQALLVRFLDTHEITRSDDPTMHEADVRIIATSTKVLNAANFRADLLARLSSFTLTLPPLAERTGDLDALVEHQLAHIAGRSTTPPKRLAPEARTVLLRCVWPGNVAQLFSVLERAVAMANDQVIHAADLPDHVRDVPIPNAAINGRLPIGSLADIERMHIMHVLDHCGGNKKAAAEILEIDRSTLYAKLRQYGVG